MPIGAVRQTTGAGAASGALWYYSRRYVGELSLTGAAGAPLRGVRLSTFDFWGRREETRVDVADVRPPLAGATRAELAEAARAVMLPLDGACLTAGALPAAPVAVSSMRCRVR